MILLDTSGLLAALMPSQHRHDDAREALEAEAGRLVISPFVLAEVDYFVGKWAGVEVEATLLSEVVNGAYELATFEAEDVGEARDVIEAYPKLRIGLADASIVVLAERLQTRRVLTLDRRHFGALRTRAGKPFELLPG